MRTLSKLLLFNWKRVSSDICFVEIGVFYLDARSSLCLVANVCVYIRPREYTCTSLVGVYVRAIRVRTQYVRELGFTRAHMRARVTPDRL